MACLAMGLTSSADDKDKSTLLERRDICCHHFGSKICLFVSLKLINRLGGKQNHNLTPSTIKYRENIHLRSLITFRACSLNM